VQMSDFGDNISACPRQRFDSSHAAITQSSGASSLGNSSGN
jgi:hypothetical protein